MSFRITFDSSARDFVLSAFGKATHDGFIVQSGQPKQKVLTPRGEEIPINEFAGVRKGSKVFIKSDIVSLVETARVISAREKAAESPARSGRTDSTTVSQGAARKRDPEALEQVIA